MPLPPDIEAWFALYRTRHPLHRSGRAVLEVLFAALSRGEDPRARELAAAAGLDHHATAARVLDRMITLGALRRTGGSWHPGGGATSGRRDPFRYESVWPPEPPHVQ